jgi:hypothetical protein
MVMVKLSASLAALLPEQTRQSTRSAIEVDAANWPETTQQIALRFQRLARHVFTETGQLRSGLLMALNDEIIKPGSEIPRLEQTDEVYLFQQIAGG